MNDYLRKPLIAAMLLGLGASSTLAQREVDPSAGPNAEESQAVREAIQGVQEIFDQIWIPRSRYTNSPHTREAFRSVVSDVRKATVEIRASGRRVALGGIVGPDGWVVTKASLIRGPVTCRLKDGRELDARLVGVDEPTDLAILKLGAKGLPTLALGGPGADASKFVALKTADATDEESTDAGEETTAEETEPEDRTDKAVSVSTLQAGDWVATPGLTRDPVAIGVVSVLPRVIKNRPGLLGIKMDIRATQAGNSSVLVETVTPGGAADEAGMLDGDRIVSIDGQPTRTSQELRNAIMGQNPGDRVQVEVLREEKRLRLLAILHGWDTIPEGLRSSAERRAHYQNKLGGDLSERRFGFPAALQHDTPLDPNECGGPLVDLDGRVVAFNISRAGRTESYALPVELVRGRLFDLMSGRLAPAGL